MSFGLAMGPKVLFITAGDITKASARFRVYQFLPYFEEHGEIEIVDAVPVEMGMSVSDTAKNLLSIVHRARRCDILFIQKARFLVPVMRMLVSSRIIYDFDDAIHVPSSRRVGSGRRRISSFDKCKLKARSLRLEWLLNNALEYADLVIAGNSNLAEYARDYCSNVIVIPTVVDTGQEYIAGDYYSRWHFSRQLFQPAERLKNISEWEAPVIVGWIGNPRHIRWLDAIGPVLRVLQKSHNIRIEIVSSREWHFPGLEVVNKPWCLRDEVTDVQGFDIGLMPLDPDVIRLRGKCGFKIIEYMAAGISPIASAVGVNTEIIEHGRTGFLVSDASGWRVYLEKLIEDPDLREKIGASARRRAVENYSIASVLDEYHRIFAELY